MPSAWSQSSSWQIALWVAVILLAFAIEIPFESWQQMSASLVAAREVGQQGHVGGLFVVLLTGPWPKLEPVIENGLGCLLSLALAAAVVMVARFRAGPRWRDLVAWHPWSWRAHARLFWILLGAALAVNVALGVLFANNHPGPAEALPPFDVPFVLGVARDLVLGAITEELVVRGWLFTGLRAMLGAWPTIVITSVLFALLHVNVHGILATHPLGLAAGYLRERTGSVKAPIALHLSHNVIATVLTTALKLV